ncbi:SGS domain-containing protein [Podospora fimiseda]|uniref:SGS domain-containing protein n=1 Tax=Podospora fimiseda TaxID=252190 RepID=A0AAN7BIT4_9PEZI|nr:SGS domain-containing protein [Podospora fimiseda]
MSSTTLGQKGLEAVKESKWQDAIPLLDKALQDSNSPAWLLARSQAHTQLKNYDAALHDAELAYHSAAERSSGTSRKFMIDAQHRRSVILFRLKRYADADCCAKWSMLLAEGRPAREDDGVAKQVDANGNYTVTYEDALKDKAGQPSFNAGLPGGEETKKTGFESQWARAFAWRSQVLQRMQTLPENDPGRKVTVTKIPTKPQPKKAEPKQEPVKIAEEPVVEKPKAPAPEPGSVPDEKLKLRVDFYQTNQNVTVTLYAKEASKDDVQVHFFKNYVQISGLPRAPAPYVKPGDREASSTFTLGGEIVPSGSRFSITPRKIELVLQKANVGTKWGTWGTEEIGLITPEGQVAEQPHVSPTTTSPVASTTSPKPTSAPAYPTSSRAGPKDWEKLGDDDDKDEKDDINGFFKSLYKGATPEQQRAMMKSFIESNGTALSTDWSDVANRTVETVPPEGVVAKKWKE